MVIINESTYLANIIKKETLFDNNIKIISTKGFLYNYIRSDDKIIIQAKDPILIDYLKNLYNEDNIFVIATDHDYPGHLISLELLDIFKTKAIRFQKSFDELLLVDKVDKNYILKNSNMRFEYGQAMAYLQMKDFNPNIHEEKIKAIARIIHDTEGKKE
jgi:hypothetical protein